MERSVLNVATVFTVIMALKNINPTLFGTVITTEKKTPSALDGAKVY